MKMLFFLLAIFTISLSVNGQEQKVEIVPLIETTESWPKSNLPVTFICSVVGIPILMESMEFSNHDDLYIYLLKTPGVSITRNWNLSDVPMIKMRDDDNTIVIVDGIRFDASILNTINPANIETVIVSPSAVATHYFINN